jgi:hypothetical protein
VGKVGIRRQSVSIVSRPQSLYFIKEVYNASSSTSLFTIIILHTYYTDTFSDSQCVNCELKGMQKYHRRTERQLSVSYNVAM